jgi:cytochrome b pre-mRNA-processing protein 3
MPYPAQKANARSLRFRGPVAGKRMIFGLFGRRAANKAIVAGLHEAVVNASRLPVFYTDLGVPDTLEGRFDLVTLHAVLVVRRLKDLPSPADELAQDLTDALFQNFEVALRELGVGDISVPKKMKVIAQAFFGRAKAYDEAFASADPQALAIALSRNLLGEPREVPPQARTLERYVRESMLALDRVGLDAFTSGVPPLPDPVRFVGEEDRS